MAGPNNERVVRLTMADGAQYSVEQERHPSRSYGTQFMILFTNAMGRAARQIHSGTTLRLLLILPEHLDFMNFRRLPTAAATELGTDASGISRGMSTLHKLGMVEREGRGPYTTWRLSSDWGWNGTPDQWHAMRAGRLKGKRPPAAAPAASPGETPGADAPGLPAAPAARAKQRRLALLAVHKPAS